MTVKDLFTGSPCFMERTIRSLPLAEKQTQELLRTVAEMRQRPGIALHLVMPGHDDPRELYLAWQGDGCKMVLVFPMEDFGWNGDLLMEGQRLGCKETFAILRGLFCEGKDTLSIPELDPFRDITYRVYGEGYLPLAGGTDGNDPPMEKHKEAI